MKHIDYITKDFITDLSNYLDAQLLLRSIEIIYNNE